MEFLGVGLLRGGGNLLFFASFPPLREFASEPLRSFGIVGRSVCKVLLVVRFFSPLAQP